MATRSAGSENMAGEHVCEINDSGAAVHGASVVNQMSFRPRCSV